MPSIESLLLLLLLLLLLFYLPVRTLCYLAGLVSSPNAVEFAFDVPHLVISITFSEWGVSDRAMLACFEGVRLLCLCVLLYGEYDAKTLRGIAHTQARGFHDA
jgi:uncharacterized membrane protein YjgN (DUF898 family)